MSKNGQRPDWPAWCAPPEVLGLLSTTFPGIVVIPLVAILAILGPLLHSALSALYWLGLGAGCIGIVLLFFARLPLYRQGRFWTFGPRELDRAHRRLYWGAYLMVAICILLLLMFLSFAK